MAELLVEKVGKPALEAIGKLILGKVCNWLERTDDALLKSIVKSIKSDQDHMKELVTGVALKELTYAMRLFKEGEYELFTIFQKNSAFQLQRKSAYFFVGIRKICMYLGGFRK